MQLRSMHMTPQPAQSEAREMLYGFWLSQCLSVVATLGIANCLASGSKTSEELAALADCHAPTVRRLLRALSTAGIFTEEPDGRFALTPLSEYLRTDVQGSLAAEARHMMHPTNWNAWGQLLHSVRTGQAAFPEAFGKDAWTYRSQHPEIGALFDRMAAAKSRQDNALFLECLDFSGVRQVVDVGGGNGAFLAEVLRRQPHIRGILLDMPHVVEAARELVAGSEVAEQMEFVAGDFLQAVPGPCDMYLLKAILHNWSHDSAVSILKNCRRAMNQYGKIVVIDMVLGPGSAAFANFMDLHMLVIHGGQERTAAEFQMLFAAAGFDLSSSVRTEHGLSVLEGRPSG